MKFHGRHLGFLTLGIVWCTYVHICMSEFLDALSMCIYIYIYIQYISILALADLQYNVLYNSISRQKYIVRESHCQHSCVSSMRSRSERMKTARSPRVNRPWGLEHIAATVETVIVGVECAAAVTAGSYSGYIAANASFICSAVSTWTPCRRAASKTACCYSTSTDGWSTTT